MKVINLSKKEADNYNKEDKYFLDSFIWINIGIPVKEYLRAQNGHLEKSPNLKIDFWDIESLVPDFSNPGKYLEPPNEQHAAAIVDFIMKHRGKPIIVNCHAGISRSGAVCAFAHRCLDYEWTDFINRAHPNKVLYHLMCDYFYDKYPQPLKTAIEKVSDSNI
jgi:hypothetical protein